MAYIFQDIAIQLNTQSEKLRQMIDDYTHLINDEAAPGDQISFTYEDGFKIDVRIPEDVVLQLDVPFDIAPGVRYKYFLRGQAESWSVFEGYGLVYVNYETGEILSIHHQEAGLLNITGFIVLFIHPLTAMLGRFGYIRLHAACLKVLDKNIMITGLSGRGKSTATFALLERGHQVLSDEMPFIRKDDPCFRAYSLLKIIKLRRQALERFFPKFEAAAFGSDADCYLRLNDINHEGLSGLQAIHQLFILEQTGTTETIINPANPLEIVPELLPTSLNVFREKQAQKSFDTIIDFLGTVACYKVYFGTDMQQFAAAIEKVRLE